MQCQCELLLKRLKRGKPNKKMVKNMKTSVPNVYKLHKSMQNILKVGYDAAVY